MKIQITARHQKLSPKIKAYIEEKLDRLDRYHDHIKDCEVITDFEKTKGVIEVNVSVYGKTINVKAKDADITKAVDTGMDKLEAQLKKFNSKIKAHPRVKVSELLVEETADED